MGCTRFFSGAGVPEGELFPGAAASFALRAQAFLEGLRDLGYVDGRTVAIEWRWGQDKVERLPELAADLVARKVDIVVTGGTLAGQGTQRCDRHDTNCHGNYRRSGRCWYRG